jgi:hypothetical protein
MQNVPPTFGLPSTETHPDTTAASFGIPIENFNRSDSNLELLYRAAGVHSGKDKKD